MVAVALVLVVALAVGVPLLWRWERVQPLQLGGVSGGGSVGSIQLPHTGTSVWLVDQPVGVVEILPLQLTNDSTRAVTLDGVEPLLHGDAGPRLRRVDEHLSVYGPSRPVRGYVLAPGEVVSLSFPVTARGCDSTGPGGTTGATIATDQVTVHFHRLGRARTAVLPMDQQLDVAYDGDTTRGDHLSCVAPVG